MYFGHVHSLSSTVLDLPPPPYPSNFVSFSLLIPTEYYLCLPNILGCGDTPWRVLNLLRITCLKEPNCLSVSNYQFPITSQLQVGLYLPPFSMLRLGLCLDSSSISCPDCYKFIGETALLCLENIHFIVIHHLWLLKSFSPLYHDCIWALGARKRCRYPVKAGDSSIDYSLHVDQLYSSVFIEICSKELLECWGIDALIYGYNDKSFRVHLFKFSRI